VLVKGLAQRREAPGGTLITRCASQVIAFTMFDSVTGERAGESDGDPSRPYLRMNPSRGSLRLPEAAPLAAGRVARVDGRERRRQGLGEAVPAKAAMNVSTTVPVKAPMGRFAMSGRGAGGRRAVLSACVLALVLPAAAEAQRVEGAFQRTLTVDGAPQIEVETGSGRIEVRAGAAGRVEVESRIQASSGWGRRSALSPEEQVRRLEANPPIQQTGQTIRIGHVEDRDLQDGVSISYTLTVPAESMLRTRSGSGSQRIEGVSGDITASTGSGSLAFLSAGGAIRAATGSGSVTAETVHGALHATTGSGSIRATGIGGPVTAKTGSGGIDVEQTAAGDVEVSSGSGTVRLRGVRGALRASTASGGVTVEGELAGDWRLSAASGTVRVTLPPEQGFELDAGTGSGRINVDVPVTVSGTVDRRSLRGSAQGGGPLLHVRTSSGSIHIR
jgi:hypothetical protein